MDIREELKKRILILDGGMGTCIQQKGLEYDGNNDALPLTRPEIISEIHNAYINAGADIISTCTFGANAISQEGYGLQEQVRNMNIAAVKVAREEAERAQKKIWVMGSIGPTPKSLVITTMMQDPSETFNINTLTKAYYEQAKALADGGVDGFLIETVTDECNAYAALDAVSKVQKENNSDLPVMLSVSIMNSSGCLMTGLNVVDLYDSLVKKGPFRLMSFGLNCSFGAKELYPVIKNIASAVDCAVSIYPNAGLPTTHGYDEGPCDTADALEKMAGDGLVNIAGGCCGTTPEHIREIASRLKNYSPRKI
ncbi:MAG: homocysteine S-methyltransferase family protein [Bacteroidaceae bacterium]|nr:homocysteine S-methyltransferase family protein [Bacteroidaceae bacterium]